MATEEDVARWMLEQVMERGFLEQERAAWEIEEQFGPEFTYINNNGNRAIDKGVLKAFNKLSENDVVWARVTRYWRPRREGDAPGRAQYE